MEGLRLDLGTEALINYEQSVLFGGFGLDLRAVVSLAVVAEDVAPLRKDLLSVGLPHPLRLRVPPLFEISHLLLLCEIIKHEYFIKVEPITSVAPYRNKYQRASIIAAAVQLGGVVAKEVVHALLGSHHGESELRLVVDLA